MKNIREVKSLIDYCKSRGLKRVKVGEIEAEFFEHSLPPGTGLSDSVKALEDKAVSDKDMLFWSSEDYLPEDDAKDAAPT